MYLLPLLQRELAVASRRPSTMRLRMLFGAGSMAMAVWALLVWGASLHSAGATLFKILVYIAGLGGLGTGLLIASDTVSRERREGTLGFLFLTDLQPVDVVVGKVAAAGLVPAVTLLSMFPALAVCQLVGGVPFAEFWRAISALLVLLLFSLSATVFTSSYCRDHRRAFTGSALFLLILNPLWLCSAAFEGTYSSQPSLYWLLLIVFSGTSVLLLFSSTAALSRNWRKDDMQPEKSQRSRVRASVGTGQRLREQSPIAWLMLRRRGARLLFISVAVLVAAASLVFFLPDGPPTVLALLFWFSLHLGFELIVMICTVYAFYFDRQDGSLELVLGTKLNLDEIFDGFAKFLFAQSRAVLLTFTLLDLLISTALFFSGSRSLAVFPLAMAGTLWISFHGLSWLGVFRSLMMNHPSLALVPIFARIFLVPLLLSALFLWAPATDYVKVAAFWVISSGFLTAFFALDARQALLKHGRTLLLRPRSEKPPHIENEWSFINWEDLDQSNSPSTFQEQRV